MVEFAQAIDTNTTEDEVAEGDDVERARERLRNFLVEEVCAERKSAEIGRGVDIRWLMFEGLMEDLRAAAVERERAWHAGTGRRDVAEEDRGKISERIREAAAVREAQHENLRKVTRDGE